MGMRGVKGEWAREQRFFTFASSPSPSWASQAVLVVKNLLADAGEARNLGSIPGSGRSRGERTGSPLQYSRLENPHGQRSLAGYSPCVRKESDTTEHLSTAQTRAKPHSMPVSIIITLKLAAILLFMVMASI